MSKKNFVTLILSTVGGILFAIGMCMCLLPEWNTLRQNLRLFSFRHCRRVGAWRWNVHGYGLGDANPGHFGGRCRHRFAALFNPVDKRFEVRRHLL